MRLICLVNNYLGWQGLEFLRQEETVVGVVLHRPEEAKFEREIMAAARSAGSEILRAESLRTPEGLEKLVGLRPDMGMSIMFGHLLKPDFLSLLSRGCLNLHPAYLPYNRGAYSNVWSIVDETPAGVTVHYIDQGIDTGDIVGQKAVAVVPTDTGETLYHKSEAAGLELLRELWPAIQSGRAPRTPQQPGEGTFHKVRDVAGIDEIDLERNYKAKDLLNILRARTFPPHAGAYFRQGGRKVHVRVQLEEGGDDKPRGH